MKYDWAQKLSMKYDSGQKISMKYDFAIKYYCITRNFREHFIFAQIRESANFAKIKCADF